MSKIAAISLITLLFFVNCGQSLNEISEEKEYNLEDYFITTPGVVKVYDYDSDKNNDYNHNIVIAIQDPIDDSKVRYTYSMNHHGYGTFFIDDIKDDTTLLTHDCQDQFAINFSLSFIYCVRSLAELINKSDSRQHITLTENIAYGEFKNCIRVDFETIDTVNSTRVIESGVGYFAPGIGLVYGSIAYKNNIYPTGNYSEEIILKDMIAEDTKTELKVRILSNETGEPIENCYFALFTFLSYHSTIYSVSDENGYASIFFYGKEGQKVPYAYGRDLDNDTDFELIGGASHGSVQSLTVPLHRLSDRFLKQ